MAQIDEVDRMEIVREEDWADRLVNWAWGWVFVTAALSLLVLWGGPVDELGKPDFGLRLLVVAALIASNLPIIVILRSMGAIIRLLAIQADAIVRSRLDGSGD